MKLGTTECLGVKEWELILFQIANQAQGSHSWRSAELCGEILLQGWFQHQTKQQGQLGLRGMGPERVGERPLVECHESLVLPQSSPMAGKGLPNLQTHVTRAIYSFLFSKKQKQTWKTTQDSDALLRWSKQSLKSYTDFLVWEHSTGAENAMLASWLQGPEYSKPAFLTNLGSLASTTFMRVILLLNNVLYSLLTYSFWTIFQINKICIDK